MKYIKGILVSSILSLSIFSCVEKDEISQWNLLHDVEDRTQALEDLCYNLNNNILSIEKLLEAQTEGITINGVQENTDGYSIFFSDGTVASIYNGKDGKNGLNGLDGKNGVDGKDGINGTDGKDGVDGKDGINGTNGKDGVDGKDGYVPQISVTKVDDTYYWTLDGEIMLDNEGNKVIAQSAKGQNGADGKDGKDGITPKLRIEKDFWEISYDNGTTWTQLAKAIGANGTNGTDGKPGITPKLEIKDGFWYVSYDNGTTFEKLGKAAGEDAQKPQFKFEDGKLVVSYDGGKIWEEIEGGNSINGNNSSLGISGYIDGYAYVDLGLPSGLKWATMNIGANTITDYGLYFWWGDTIGYEINSGYSGFKYGTHTSDTFSKNEEQLKNSGIIGENNCLTPERDAATQHWGTNWRTPTRTDYKELINECRWTWISYGSTNGYKVESKKPNNSNWIFLPAGGELNPDATGVGKYGRYLGSSLYSGTVTHLLEFTSASANENAPDKRYLGRNVRAVSDK